MLWPHLQNERDGSKALSNPGIVHGDWPSVPKDTMEVGFLQYWEHIRPPSLLKRWLVHAYAGCSAL
jgi:hypothetical protein